MFLIKHWQIGKNIYFYSMNQNDFSILMHKNKAEIAKIQETYPFFVLPRFAYLKQLKEDSVEYQQKLEQTAVYAYDNESLYHFLHGGEFNQMNYHRTIQEEVPDITEPIGVKSEKIEILPVKEPIVASSIPADIQKTEPVLTVREEPKVEKVEAKMAPVQIEKEEIQEAIPAENVPNSYIEFIHTEPEVVVKGEDLAVETKEMVADEVIEIDSSSELVEVSQNVDKEDIVLIEETKTSIAPEPILVKEPLKVEPVAEPVQQEVEQAKIEEPKLIAPESKKIEEAVIREIPVPEIKEEVEEKVILEASENSFLQWLKIVQAKEKMKQIREANAEVQKKLTYEAPSVSQKEEKIKFKKDAELDALNTFVKEQLKRKKKPIHPHVMELPFDEAMQKSVEEVEVITEAMAKLLMSQKKYEKAKAVFEKLILKYPDKSATFALQIEKINQELGI